jgi:hypothetical protein
LHPSGGGGGSRGDSGGPTQQQHTAQQQPQQQAGGTKPVSLPSGGWLTAYNPWTGTIQLWSGARHPPLAPIPRPPQQQQSFVAQQQQMPKPQQPFQPQLQPYQLPAAPRGASEVGQWGPADSYNPMTGLPSWDTQSLASMFSTATLNQPSSSEWYFNSGASSHMTSTPHSLSQTFSQRYPAPSSIIVGNGSMIPVTTGTTELPHSLQLNNILVSPQIIKNLIFVRRRIPVSGQSGDTGDPARDEVSQLRTR